MTFNVPGGFGTRGIEGIIQAINMRVKINCLIWVCVTVCSWQQ